MVDRSDDIKKVAVMFPGVNFEDATTEDMKKVAEQCENINILKRRISWVDESPYTCSQCHMFNAEGERCDNPIAPFLTEPGGFCGMFTPTPLNDPDGPRAWLLLGKVKGPKKI